MRIRHFLLISVVSAAFAVAQSGDTSIDTYEGPSVLSRGGASTAGERAGRLTEFQYWGSLTGVYDSGLTDVAVGPNGQTEPVDAAGILAGGGIAGSKTWKRDLLRVDYSGNIQRYSNASQFDGTNQLLQLDWRHIMSRHLSFELHEVGGISSLSYGDLAFVPLRNSDLVGLPQNQLFDTKSYFTEAGGELYWQKTARLSFGVGGEGFLIDYKSHGLAGMMGWQARADAVYRLTRRSKVFAMYRAMRFDYKRAFGYSDIGTYAAGYSLDIGPRWSIEGEGGATRVHTLGLIQTAVDPAIAAIVGTDYTITTADRIVYAPDAELQITRRFRRSAFNVGGALSVVPGNGVYLTSRADRAFATYSVIGTRRLSLNAVFAYSSLSSVGQQIIGKYEALNGGAGATYRLKGNLHSELRYDFYHYTTQNSLYHKNENRIAAGIAYSSGERPLAIW